MHPLFRPQALRKVSDPDQLDQAMRIVRPVHGLAFALVGLVILAGLTWGFISTAPVMVAGPGVLLSPSGVASITAPDGGHIDRVLVKPGDRVHHNQPIAIIRRLDRLDELKALQAEAGEAAEQRIALKKEFAMQEKLQRDLQQRVGETTKNRVASLEEQVASLNKRLQGEISLRSTGMISAYKLFDTETQLAQTKNELAIAKNRLAELSLEHEQQASRRRQDLANLDIRSQNLSRRADNLRREYERDRQVLAANDGTIAEIGVDVADPVVAGQVIARVLVDAARGSSLTAITYLPASEGKKVKPDMAARVSPSTTKVELDGYIMGRVIRIAELPASREGVVRRLRNAVLADEILRGGTPFEVEVELTQDATTPSGFAWSSGEGPSIQIEPGTLARTQVVVDRVHLISLLFPAMDYVFGWFRTL